MVRHSIVGLLMILLLPAEGGLGQQAKLQEPLEFSESSIDLEEAVGSPILPQAADRGPMAGPGLSLTQSQPEPFYNLLSAPEEPQGGAFIRVQSSSPNVGLLIYGRIAIDTVTSMGDCWHPMATSSWGLASRKASGPMSSALGKAPLVSSSQVPILVTIDRWLALKPTSFRRVSMPTSMVWRNIFFMPS